jgi:hypothetical protein
MGMVNMYRYFDASNRPYKRAYINSTKAKAKEVAEKARRAGQLARVTKEAKGYDVWIKAKKG